MNLICKKRIDILEKVSIKLLDLDIIKFFML